MAKKKRKSAKSKKQNKKKDIARYYDASQSSNYHKAIRGGTNSADSSTHNAVVNLRSWSRYLDENHDIAIGVFSNIVDRVIGSGLHVEPVVKSASGDLNESLNDRLREMWEEFWEFPEVTGEVPGNEVERLLCRTWLRDGEVLINHKIGEYLGLTYSRPDVPYALELLEGDYLPMDLNDDRIRHGVEKNAWGRPVAYHLYLEHPGNTIIPFSRATTTTKRVSADFITHLKFARRIRQTRGVPIIHGVIHRLDDIRDYENSEAIAARVVANWTAYIRRTPDYQGTVDEYGNIPFEMQSGTIFDGLGVGEELAAVGADRPNPNLGEFRNDLLRAVSAGTNTSHSSIAKRYDGTYSAQRQEMVESVEGYKKLRKYFISVVMKRVYQNFILSAFRNRAITGFGDLDPIAVARAVDIRGPGVPWIDPLKETQADVLQIEKGLKSRHQIIRERGGDPRLVDQEIAMDTLQPEVSESQDVEPDESVEADQEDTAA